MGVAVSLPESRRSPTYAWASIRAFGIDLKPEREIEPEDLLKYGLIPEFVGRLPVIATLEDLDEASLKLILTQPKNALVKQYQRLFEMEGVDLTVAGEALGAIIIAFISHSDFPRAFRLECLLYAFACAEVSCATVREAVRSVIWRDRDN